MSRAHRGIPGGPPPAGSIAPRAIANVLEPWEFLDERRRRKRAAMLYVESRTSTPQESCARCGASLEGKRRHAVTCGAACQKALQRARAHA